MESWIKKTCSEERFVEGGGGPLGAKISTGGGCRLYSDERGENGGRDGELCRVSTFPILKFMNRSICINTEPIEVDLRKRLIKSIKSLSRIA